MKKEIKKTRREEMFSLVDLWIKSGERRSDFCRNRNLNVHTFKYWQIKHKKINQTPVGFTAVVLKTPENQKEQICLEFPNGVRAKLSGHSIESIINLIRQY